MAGPSRSGFQPKELVFAIASVNGATAACAEHGDLAMAQHLAVWYALAADTARLGGGNVVKVMGDGIVITFPPSRAAEAVTVLRTLQQRGTDLWAQFDTRCRVQLKAGSGSLITGAFGPPGQERDDVYGDALNRLFKMPLADFSMSPELSARISS